MPSRTTIRATVTFRVDDAPGQDQAMERVRELNGQELQLDRKNTGVGITRIEGEAVVGVEPIDE